MDQLTLLSLFFDIRGPNKVFGGEACGPLLLFERRLKLLRAVRTYEPDRESKLIVRTSAVPG